MLRKVINNEAVPNVYFAIRNKRRPIVDAQLFNYRKSLIAKQHYFRKRRYSPVRTQIRDTGICSLVPMTAAEKEMVKN